MQVQLKTSMRAMLILNSEEVLTAARLSLQLPAAACSVTT